jgi:hypothetical protein
VRQEWEPRDLIEVWTLLEEDQERPRNKSGANRLAFALLLKLFEVEARSPEDAGEIPVPAGEAGAGPVCGVPPPGGGVAGDLDVGFAPHTHTADAPARRSGRFLVETP